MRAKSSRRLIRQGIYGGLAGLVGSACMLPLRIAAHRAGLIDRTVPQAIEEAIAQRLNLGRGAGPEYHHLLDHLLHLAYGATLGAGYGLVTRPGRQSLLTRGTLLGALTWLVGAKLILPRLGGVRPPAQSRPAEIAVNLGAHIIYGLVTVLETGELATQSDRGPRPNITRWFTRVG